MKIILGEKLFDYDEIASLLGVCKTSISHYVKKYELKPTVIKRRKYLAEKELRKMLIPDKKKED